MTVPEALQAWLALEHEAVWLYPVVGARIDGLRGRATASFEAHRDVRDDLVVRLRELGAEPGSAALGYRAGSLATAEEANGAARSLEARICAAELALAGTAEGELRELAVTALRTSALAEQTWGATPKAFPGLP